MTRKRTESGATLVEFAFVLPVLALLVFGVIEFGYNFNNYISVRQGVREGARQGVVANYTFSSGCTLTGSGATGASTSTKSLMCLTKDRIGLATTPPSELRVKVRFDPAGNGNYVAGNGLVVCAEYPAKSFTGIISPFLSGVLLKSKTEMRIEQVPPASGTAATEGSEDPVSGTWDWC